MGACRENLKQSSDEGRKFPLSELPATEHPPLLSRDPYQFNSSMFHRFKGFTRNGRPTVTFGSVPQAPHSISSPSQPECKKKDEVFHQPIMTPRELLEIANRDSVQTSIQRKQEEEKKK